MSIIAFTSNHHNGNIFRKQNSFLLKSAPSRLDGNLRVSRFQMRPMTQDNGAIHQHEPTPLLNRSNTEEEDERVNLHMCSSFETGMRLVN